MDLPCTQLLLDDFDETGLSETSEKLQVGSLIVSIILNEIDCILQCTLYLRIFQKSFSFK